MTEKDPVLEDLKDLDENGQNIHYLEEDPKGWPRWLKIAVGIFLLSTTVVYFLPGDVVSVFSGRFVSAEVGLDYTVEYENGQVIFNYAVLQRLHSWYIDNPATEQKICLLGEKVGDDYYIDGLYKPTIFSQSVIHVSSEGCNRRTLISMHTHPFRHCLFSEQDVKSHNNFKKKNPEGLTAIMCEPSRFSFLV